MTGFILYCLCDWQITCLLSLAMSSVLHLWHYGGSDRKKCVPTPIFTQI